MNRTHLAAAFALVASSLLVAVGCGGDKSSGTSGAAAAGPATRGATAAGGKAGVVATCNKKGVCTEYRNAVPDLSEDLCKGTDGTFAKGSTPCPTEKLLGTCVNKLTPDTTTYWYGGPEEADLDKGLCEALDGKWTVGGSAKAAGSGTAAAGAGTGAATTPAAAGTGAAATKAATPAKAAPPAPPAKKKK